MNFTEHKDYLIAILVSLTFHLLLLIINLPGIPASQNRGLETFPVGLVEIASGSPKGVMVSLPKYKLNRSVALNSPGRRKLPKVHQGITKIKSNENPHQPPKDAIVLSKKKGIAVSDNHQEKPGDYSTPGGNTAIKPIVNPNQPPKDSTVPKKEEMAVADNPTENPGNQSTPSGNNEAITGSDDSATSQPQGLGTGEGMVTVLGPMPAYPQNAKNEGKEGYVEVRILVNAAGSLELVIVTDSSDDIRLDYAATSSIEQGWKFKAVAKNYFIDLIFSFKIQTGVSVEFIDSETRP